MIRFRTLTALGLALLLAPGLASAQQPPADHGGATSAPLFVADLPVGTVSVRLARPSMTDALAGVDVVGTWTAPDGKRKSSKVQSGKDGRAIFADVPVGSAFQAQATVEGEHLVTARFPVPAEGGTRLLMVVGAEAAEAMSDMTGGAAAPNNVPAAKPGEPQMVGVRAGKVEAKDALAAGMVDLRVVSADGKPLAGIKVSLGHVEHGTGAVEFVEAVSDPSGLAHFEKLQTGPTTQYAAVIEREGMRLGTDAFALDEKRGAAGELRIPGRTSDLSVLHVSASSRMMVELREDAVGVLQNLILENTSDKVFDPGPGGLMIPLPDGFTGAEKLPGGAEVEIKEGTGVVVRSLLPPSQSPTAVTQVRIGYVLTTHENRDFDIVQPMPLGMQGGLVLIPAEYTIDLSAPGLRRRAAERDDSGNELRMFDLDAIPPGHALRLTVHGIPTHDQVGKWIAGVLVALLIAAGAVAVRRPRGAAVLHKAG
jgi:hypothetical protein